MQASIENYPIGEVIRYDKTTHPLVAALPYYHLVPKDPAAHLKWRIWLRRRALEEPGFQKVLWKMCQRDPLFFINAFCWIDEPRIGESDASGLIPFNTWVHQDPVIANLAHFAGRRHSVIDKSRAQGASWLVLCLLLWMFIFRPRSVLGMASITREMADDPDAPESLGWKFDMLLEFLPKWMTLYPEGHKNVGKPIFDRNIGKSTWSNRLNGASLKAHSATKGLGRGGRYTIYFLDEASFFLPGKDTEAIQGLTGAGTNCIILASTPNGCENEHSYRLDNPHTWLTHILDWTDNPYQSRCLYTVTDGGEVKKLDDIPFPPGYAPVMDKLFGIRSPWFDRKCADNRNNVIYINREWNRDRGGSRARPFDRMVLDRARASCLAPFKSGDLSFDPFDLEDVQFTTNGRKSWDLWISLIDGRPPRDQYVFGADIASGAGGDWSSSSVLSIWNLDGVQVASFARHDITPVDFAHLTMAAWHWFTRDHRKPLVVPESNAGGGKLYTKTLVELGCSRIYAPPQRADRDTGERQKKYGYFNSDTFETLSPLIRELTASSVTPRDAKLLDEAGEYVYDRNGKAVHPKAQIAEDGSSRGMNHGDRAIGGALAIRGIKSLNGLKPIKIKANPESHNRMLAKGGVGTLAWRIREAQRQERESRRSEFEF
jgi:hypothetical protein